MLSKTWPVPPSLLPPPQKLGRQREKEERVGESDWNLCGREIGGD